MNDLPRRFASRASLILLLMLLTALAMSFARPLPAQDPDDPDQPAQAQPDLLQKLQQTQVTLAVDEVDVLDVIAMVFERAGVPYVVSGDLADDLLDAGYYVGVSVKDMPATTVLDAVMSLVECRCTQQGGAMLVHYAGDGPVDLETAIYDVSDIIAEIPDRPASIVGPQPRAGYGCWDLERPEYLDVDEVEELLMTRLEEIDDYGNFIVSRIGDTFSVQTSAEGHERIQRTLAELRSRAVRVRMVVSEWQICATAWQQVVADGCAGGILDDNALKRLYALPAAQARRVRTRRIDGANWQMASASTVQRHNWVTLVHDELIDGQRFRTVDQEELLSGTALQLRAVTSLDSDRILVEASVQSAVVNDQRATGSVVPAQPIIPYQSADSRVLLPDGGTAVVGGSLCTAPALPEATDASVPTLALITARRFHPPAPPASKDDNRTARLQAMQQRLASTRVSIHAEEVPVEVVVRGVLEKAGIGLLVSPEVLDCSHDERALTLDIDGITADRALALVRGMLRDTGIMLTTAADNLMMLALEGESYMPPHRISVDVNDLLMPNSSRLWWPGLVDPFQPAPIFPEDEDNHSIEREDLIDALMTTMERYGWEDGFVQELPPGRIEMAHENLEALAAGRQLVETLRASALGHVTLQWELRDVTDNALLADLQMADSLNPGLATRLAGNSSLRQAGVASAPLNQRSSFCSGTWHGRTTDEQGIAGNAPDEDGNVSTPREWIEHKASLVLEGVSLSVRPTICGDGRIAIDLRMLLGDRPVGNASAPAAADPRIVHTRADSNTLLTPGTPTIAAILDSSAGPTGGARVLVLRADIAR